MILNIAKYPDPILRKSMQKVEGIDTHVSACIEHMTDTLRYHAALGLAAPQVFIPLRIAVIDMKECHRRQSVATCPTSNGAEFPDILVLVNPVINTYGLKTSATEGCLSFDPRVRVVKTRPSSVEVEYLDEKGKPQQLFALGLLARCIQHEVDHLNGRLFIDDLDSTQTQKVNHILNETIESKLK